MPSTARRMDPQRLRLHRPDAGPLTQLFHFPQAGLYRLTAWTHAEWIALPEAERPDDAIYVPAFGWACYRLVSEPCEAGRERA